MLNPSILYIKQKDLYDHYLGNDALLDIYQEMFGKEFLPCVESMIATYPDMRSWYPRFGKNTTCFPSQTLRDMGFPDLRISDRPQNFCEITNQRCCDLSQSLSDRPWMICWSGGIDSTVIVSSILKNLSLSRRSDFAIFCNGDSVWESPDFFNKFIKPNFRVIHDSDGFRLDEYLQDYYVIDGDPADYLWDSRLSYQLGDAAGLSWQQDPGLLLEYYSNRMKSKDLAQWFYHSVSQNIESVEWPIVTYAHWCWWANFNFNYTDSIMRKIYRHHDIGHDMIDMSYINWYHTNDYNNWSLGRILGKEKNTLPFEHKLEAKKYVHDLSRDDHWVFFKSKISSGSRENYANLDGGWLAISDTSGYVSDPMDLYLIGR
jgi:hypothetical protein